RRCRRCPDARLTRLVAALRRSEECVFLRSLARRDDDVSGAGARRSDECRSRDRRHLRPARSDGTNEATDARYCRRVMKLIPDYSSRGAAALAERSVMQWPEKITVPLLMIHGTDDEEVPVSQALAFATKLSCLRKEYELIVYAKEIHEALNNRRD